MQTVLPGIQGLPLSERPLLHTREPARAGSAVGRLADPLSFAVTTPAAGIDIHLTGVALARLQVFGVRHTASVAVRSGPLGSHHIVIPLRGRLRTRSGPTVAHVTPGTAVNYAAGTRLDARWESDCTALVVTVGRGELERLPSDGRSLPVLLPLGDGPGRSLANRLACLCFECNAAGAGAPAVVAGLEALVLRALLDCAPAAPGAQSVASTWRRRRGLALALAHLRAHPHRRIDVDELARIACLSRRSLQMAFVEHFGIGPQSFARQERLAGARAELAANASEPLALLAARWGFDDPGTFARAYRRAFGEAPSATANRARGAG